MDVFNQGLTDIDVWVLFSARWAALLVITIFYATPLRAIADLGSAAFLIYSIMAFVAAMNAMIYKSHGLSATEPAIVVVIMAFFCPLD
ncbi:MAG: hypothetical protein MO846_04515 [Candidatus Devosia symbiotica]|nr:hypothetical protein [Candidatus Devosia symbiotica]